MDRNTIADILIHMMPFSNGLKALAFFLIWLALSRQRTTTALGLWINRFFLSVFALSIFNTYLTYYLSRSADGANIDGAVEWSLIVGLNAIPLIVSFAGLRVGHWTRQTDAYVISNEGVFGTLAQAMPIIVADHKGIIQHTTPAFDELANAAPGELIGRDLKTIMPQRYRGRHDGGMEHYVKTREKRIVGTVVTVEMLRMDGTEVPVYLALNTTDVDGDPWFVAALWQKEPETPDTLISEHERTRADRQDARDEQQDARQHRQDDREVGQDERALDQDMRGWGMSKESMKQEGQQRELDVREHDLDVRDEEGGS